MMHPSKLSTVTWLCVHFLSEAEASAQLVGQLQASGLAIFAIDGSILRTQQELFSALADEMRLPGYFGMNWDALDECLRDMEWLPAKGYVLFVRNAEQFWCQATPVAGGLVESWLFSAEYWSHQVVPFHLVFCY